ncbi:hypothetical protein KTQ94_10520, partial [Prevotella stercorea]|uniref:hypothetical protein n=1 Tax=Leyella stercorea TaxID=363265 RepID=UPI001C2C4610
VGALETSAPPENSIRSIRLFTHPTNPFNPINPLFKKYQHKYASILKRRKTASGYVSLTAKILTFYINMCNFAQFKLKQQ